MVLRRARGLKHAAATPATAAASAIVAAGSPAAALLLLQQRSQLRVVLFLQRAQGVHSRHVMGLDGTNEGGPTSGIPVCIGCPAHSAPTLLLSSGMPALATHLYVSLVGFQHQPACIKGGGSCL